MANNGTGYEYMKGKNNVAKRPEVREKIRQSRLRRKEKLGYINSPKTRRRISKGMKGNKNRGTLFSWTEASQYISEGYLCVTYKQRKLRIHDLIWCSQPENINYIPKGFVIHHIDTDKLNNDIDNLILITRSDHSKFHWNYKKQLEGGM